MNWIINIVAKYSGFGWIWAKLDGAKTYIAATAGLLTGLGGLLDEFMKVEAQHNFGAILGFIKGLPLDQNWILILASLGAIGIGHKLAKSATSTISGTPIDSVPPIAPKP